MRRYDDENRTRYIGDISEMGARRGERTNPAIQIIHGLSRMQDNIRNIRNMRQQKLMEDKKNEFAMKKADIGIQEMELQLGPDGAAAAREEFNLRKKKTQLESQLADRKLQRAQLSAEESFAGGLRFASAMNQKLRADEKRMKEETGKDFFLGNVGIDKDQNFILDTKQQSVRDKDKELALKASGEEMDADRYDKAMALLSRGSAAPSAAAVDPASIKGAPKDGQRARVPGKGIVQYNAKTRKWAKV